LFGENSQTRFRIWVNTYLPAHIILWGNKSWSGPMGIDFEEWLQEKPKTIPPLHKLFHKLPKATAKQNTLVIISSNSIVIMKLHIFYSLGMR